MVPTLPFDHGCDDIQVIASLPSRERRAEDVVDAFGEEMAALVHLHEGVAALHGGEFGGHVARRAVAHVPEIEVVGRADEDDGVLLRRVFGAVDVGGHALAVAHRDHQFAIDDGELCKFLFGGVRAAMSSLFGAGRCCARVETSPTATEGRKH